MTAPIVRLWHTHTIDGEVGVADFSEHLEFAEHMKRHLADAERRVRTLERTIRYQLIIIVATAFTGLWMAAQVAK
jgi:hypothetical protein